MTAKKTNTRVTSQPSRLPLLGRLPLLVLGIVALVCGVWGGLIRLPLNLPLPANNANWITYHGPLMVCGFLGTVIALALFLVNTVTAMLWPGGKTLKR